MLKPQALANAITTVFIVAYLICGVIAFVAPDFLYSIANSWFHAIDVASVRATTPMGFGTFVFGVVTFGAYIWILTYAVASLYNKFTK